MLLLLHFSCPEIKKHLNYADDQRETENNRSSGGQGPVLFHTVAYPPITLRWPSLVIPNMGPFHYNACGSSEQTPKALYTFQPALSLSLAYNINDKQGCAGVTGRNYNRVLKLHMWRYGKFSENPQHFITVK